MIAILAFTCSYWKNDTNLHIWNFLYNVILVYYHSFLYNRNSFDCLNLSVILEIDLMLYALKLEEL